MNNRRRFDGITYEDFKKLAKTDGLSDHEKIGFPNELRENKEDAIFKDILSKVPQLSKTGGRTLDIGIGCGRLAHLVHQHVTQQSGELIASDSKEMLEALKLNDIEKVDGQFPENYDKFENYIGNIDAIICYSVIHYVHPGRSLFVFIDAALKLLKSGGALLIGDIPNFSMRNRLLESPTGIKYHQEYMGDDSLPKKKMYNDEFNEIDDGVILGLMMHYRARGFNVFILPQSEELPMANRREDLLILKM